MLLEILGRVAAGDLLYPARLAFGNIAMAFILIAVFSIFLEGKNLPRGFLVIFVTLFAFLDFEKVLGITFFTGSFFLLYYISKLSVLAIAEGSKSLKGKMIFINEVQFYAALLISVLFFGGG